MAQSHPKPHILYIARSTSLLPLFRQTLAKQYRLTYRLPNRQDAGQLLSCLKFDLILLQATERYDSTKSNDQQTSERGWVIDDGDCDILELKTKTLNAATPLFMTLTFDDAALADQARRLGVTRVFRKADFSPDVAARAIQQQLASPGCGSASSGEM